MIERFELTAEERMNPLWRRLMGHMETSLHALRVRNDAAQDEKETARIRGEIHAIKTMMALDKPAPLVEKNLPPR